MTKAEIQLVRSLADKRARDEQGLFVAEGEKLIAEIRASGWRIRKIFALEGLFEGEAVETLSRKELERVSLLKTPSKAVAIVEIPRHTLHIEQLKGQLALVLDEVQNPGNLGTIIRIADWFGLTDIVCSPDSADCFNPKVVQATMGAILRVKVHYLPLAEFLRRSAESGVAVYGTMLDGEDIYGEGRLPELLRELCKIEKLHWIRTLYTYPERITDELLEVIAREKKLVKYLDIPVQHGSSSVLKRMGRKTPREKLISRGVYYFSGL